MPSRKSLNSCRAFLAHVSGSGLEDDEKRGSLLITVITISASELVISVMSG
jgi:hypothetical protein